MEITRDLMSAKLITMKPEDSIIDAHLTMKEKEIRHIPIINKENQLVGIVSSRDVQKAMIIKKLNEFNNEIIIPSDYKIQDFMNWPVVTVRENTHIKLVAEILLTEKISSLVVLDEKSNITGIVTTTDILTYVIKMIEDQTSSTHLTLAYYLSKQ